MRSLLARLHSKVMRFVYVVRHAPLGTTNVRRRERARRMRERATKRKKLEICMGGPPGWSMSQRNTLDCSSTIGMDEDDPVVQRIPVHLSKASSGLFVFEYSRNNNSFEKNRIVKSRIKPNQQKVELHLKLDVESKNFNSDLARKLASKGTKAPTDNAKQIIETQVLSSSTAVSKNPRRYAIGVAQKDGIHLNPLTGIVFLKPSHEYLDVSSKRKDMDDGGPSSLAAAAKPVTASFAGKSTKRMAQSKSLANQQKIKDEEPWCDVNFYPANDIKSIREKEKLNCEQTENDISGMFCDDAEAYLPGLCPPEADDGSCKTDTDNILSAEELSKLPLPKQIMERMKQVHVIKFSRLKHLLGGNFPDKEIISGLIRVADLIRGNWVLKSSLLYDKEFTSSRGVSADRLSSARDKILLAFMNQDSVACKKLSKITKIPAEDIIEILMKMAYKVSKVGWKFKLDEDEQFIKSFSDVVEQQTRLLETRVKNQEKKEEEEAADAKAAAKKAKSQGRQRKSSTRSRKDSQCSDLGS